MAIGQDASLDKQPAKSFKHTQASADVHCLSDTRNLKLLQITPLSDEVSWS